MLYEYAVEPAAISSDWQTCRYLSEKFGFDRGRLMALYPKKWLPLAIEAAGHLRDVEKKTVVERLVKLKRDASLRSGRPYDPATNWLTNAIAQHASDPFHAILASHDPDAHAFILTAEEIEETHPLMKAPHDIEVARNANAIARELNLLLKSASSVLFVDGYYDPFNAKYQRTLRACLRMIHAGNPRAVCEIHHLDHGHCPSAEAIEREAGLKFHSVIPDGMSLIIYRWRERSGGADFHARYLLTDRGGVRIDAGFSAEGDYQTTDMMLMDLDLVQAKLQALRREADVYELVEPVLQIASNGDVQHV